MSEPRDITPIGLPSRIGFLRLLQLASPALPVGAFAYSQGLEAAITCGHVTDERTASLWISGLLTDVLAYQDLALFVRLHAAAEAGDRAALRRWNDFLFATRGAAELQTEDRHLGGALARVLNTLGVSSLFDDSVATTATTTTTATARAVTATATATATATTTPSPPITFAAHFACASATWGIDVATAAEAFAFTWAESQTSAAVRAVPLGQSAGVRILAGAADVIPKAVAVAMSLTDDELGASAPNQALLSIEHETQYSRLFRS